MKAIDIKTYTGCFNTFKCHLKVTTWSLKSDQGTFTPVGAQGGVIPLRKLFSTGILQWNLHHIYMHFKKKIIILKRIWNRFKMAAK